MASPAAFTLIEMLVVLAIIGLMTAIGLPYMKGINRSNTMAAATRQLLDDLDYARHRAISGRTTVYVVFMPPANPAEAGAFTTLGGALRTNMLTGQLTSYALFARRAVGEQPGQSNPRYLTKWHRLPEGIFIPDYKFSSGLSNVAPFKTSTKIPVPTVDGVMGPRVQYVAFDYQGRLVLDNDNPALQDEVIPLARGSIFFARDGNGALAWDWPDAQENPPDNSINNFNQIRVDALTGRARVERPEIAP